MQLNDSLFVILTYCYNMQASYVFRRAKRHANVFHSSIVLDNLEQYHYYRKSVESMCGGIFKYSQGQI